MGLGWRGADAGAVSLGVSAGSRGLGPFGGHDWVTFTFTGP